MKHRLFPLMLALLMLCASSALAHPPKAVTPYYDMKTGELTVKIVHTTTNPAVHYAYMIEIAVNGDVVKEDDSLKQTNKTNLTYTTSLRGVKDGDKITVSVSCNRGGTKTATITAGDASAAAVTAPAKTYTKPAVKETMPEKPKKKKSFWDY